MDLARIEATSASVADGEALVQSFLATLTSPRSVTTMRESFQRIARVLEFEHYALIPWTKLGFDELMLIRRKLADKCPPATANLSLSAVRGLLAVAADRGLVTEGLLAMARRRLKNVRGSRISTGRRLSADEIANLDVAAGMFDDPKGTMLRAILALGVGLGLRREEICSLPLTAVRPGELRVIGKGNKERACPLEDDVANRLAAWIAVRKVLDWPHDTLFASPSHGKPLSKQTLWWLVYELAEAAGVADFSPHDMRRTFASIMLENGMDILELQALMGHAKPETTARYDKRGFENIATRRRKVRVYPEKEQP